MLMKLSIEDFVAEDIDSEELSGKNGSKKNETDDELKKYTKTTFDSFYSLYKHAGEGEYLPNLSLDRLTQMVLINENFQDITACEQIWQQIQLSSNFVGPRLQQQIVDLYCLLVKNADEPMKGGRSLNSDVNIEGQVGFEDGESGDESLRSDEVSADEDAEDVQDFDANDDDDDDDVADDNDDDDDGDDDDTAPFGNDDDEEETLENLDLDSEEPEQLNIESPDDAEMKQERRKSVKGRGPLEDDFLKMDDLEAFLEQEDAREEKLMKQLEGKSRVNEENEDENDEDDDVDYFTDLGKEGLSATYKDFFDAVGETKRVKNKKRMVTFQDENEVQPSKKEKRDLFADEDDDKEDENGNLSMHERRLAKYREKIEEFEDMNVAEKPWQLTGEINANSRPGDSLLTELLTFDSSAQLPPEITAERTETMEQKIMQRIKDRAFDDVVKKYRPKEQPFEYKKRLLISQEKSSMGLAEVYEQEFLKQVREEQKEEKNEKHEAIGALMKSVFKKLDMLSHFSLTPEAPSTEMKIVNNAPAVSMEEAVPVALADSNQLAPEEIRKVKSSEEKAVSERTKTDKLRQQRHRKAKQKAIAAAEAKKLHPDSKEKALFDLKKDARNNKNIKIASTGAPRYQMSVGKMTTTSFFSQLSDRQNKSETNVAKKKTVNADSASSVSRYKL